MLGINTARSFTFKHGSVSEDQMQRIRACFDAASDKLHVLVTHHPLFAMPLAVPFYLIFCFAPSLTLTMTAAAIMNFLLSSGMGPCIAAAARMSPPSMRAVSSTLMLAASGIIGGALAPLIVGIISDLLKSHPLFAQHFDGAQEQCRGFWGA